MGIALRSQSTQASDAGSGFMLESSFETYTDSLETEDVTNIPNPRPDPHFIPHSDRVGRYISRAWHRTLAILFPSFALRHMNQDEDKYDALPLLSENPLQKRRKCHRPRWSRWLLRGVIGFFVMLGIIQFICLSFGIIYSFFPDEYDRAARVWTKASDDARVDDMNHWPTDISREIIPKGCHSHNDYWRRVPLYSALQAGCTGVEADVWLFNQELYVGHTSSSLSPRRTLRSIYVDPLVEILDKQNPITSFHRTVDSPPHGVWDTDPDQSVILLIDFKTEGVATWPTVMESLGPLRERGYLTYFNGRDLVPGPVTVVGTGNTPFDLVTANSTYRDIFFDAPLDKLMDVERHVDGRAIRHVKRSDGLGQGLSGMPDVITAHTFNITNSYYASVSFKKAIGFPWPFHFSQRQMDLIRTQVRIAHQHGLKVRYWALPSWPRSLRNHVWRILAQEGVDMLNVDDLIGATKGDWSTGFFDWWT